MKHISDRIRGGQAVQADVDLLYDVATQIRGKCLCALGEFAVEAVISGIERFGADFQKQVQQPEKAAIPG